MEVARQHFCRKFFERAPNKLEVQLIDVKKGDMSGRSFLTEAGGCCNAHGEGSSSC